jgi:RNA polymerase sigma-70 factor (ECF subfamily)
MICHMSRLEPGARGFEVTGQDEWTDLIAAVAERRDRAAFTRLFDHYAPRINGYLLRLGADAALADELTQEVMVTLWRKAEQFDRSKSSVATWLYRIARNRRIDMLRRNRSEPLDSEEAAQVPSEAAAADDAMDSMQREDRVRAAMETLPPEQLALIRLAFFENLSHSDIAEKLSLPLGTVKSRIRLAFTRLRRQLEAGGVDTAI